MTDAMKLTSKQFTSALRELENSERRDYLARSDARDLARIGVSDHHISVVGAWAKLSPAERETIRQGSLKKLAEREAGRQLDVERAAFLSSLREKYGAK